MRNMHVLVSAAMMAGALMSIPAFAQSAEPSCAIGLNSFTTGGGGSRTVAFSTVVKTSYEQKLPDGSYIRGYQITHQASDGAGRVRIESAKGCARGEGGKSEPISFVDVLDEANKTSLYWETGPGSRRVATVSSRTQTAPTLSPEELAERRIAMEQRQPPRSEFTHEDLGTRMIAGVEAHGSRTTRKIPAGEEGNEVGLTVTDERWMSRELGTVMLSITDDPRKGKTTWEVEEVVRGKPNESSFLPPEGYKTEERRQPVTVPVANVETQPSR